MQADRNAGTHYEAKERFSTTFHLKYTHTQKHDNVLIHLFVRHSMALSVTHITLSVTHTTLSVTHTTLSVTHTTLSVTHTILSVTHILHCQ